MYYFIIIFLIIFFDQLSKIWIKTNLGYHESIQILGDFIRFTFIENPGIAFGISTGNFSILILILSIIIIIYIIKEIISNKEMNSSIGLSMIVGGAIGNLIDRIFMYIPQLNYGGVVDFIDIGTTTYRWYTFNVADSFVCVGMVLYLVMNQIEIKRH